VITLIESRTTSDLSFQIIPAISRQCSNNKALQMKSMSMLRLTLKEVGKVLADLGCPQRRGLRTDVIRNGQFEEHSKKQNLQHLCFCPNFCPFSTAHGSLLTKTWPSFWPDNGSVKESELHHVACKPPPDGTAALQRRSKVPERHLLSIFRTIPRRKLRPR
jgi:hypothetical protein